MRMVRMWTGHDFRSFSWPCTGPRAFLKVVRLNILQIEGADHPPLQGQYFVGSPICRAMAASSAVDSFELLEFVQ